MQEFFSGGGVKLKTRLGLTKFYHFLTHTLENWGGGGGGGGSEPPVAHLDPCML